MGIRNQSVARMVVLAFSGALAWAQSGGVAGVVKDQQGRPVAGAQVSLLRRPAGPADTVPYHASADALANGGFSFSGVPAGRYQLCAQKGNSDLLNPCTWASGPMVNVGSAAITQDIVMESGHRLKLRLDDSRGVFAANRESASLGRVYVSLLSESGGFIPLAPGASDARGKDYEYLIPFGKPVKLRVGRDKYDLEDDKGVRADRERGQNVDINVARGQAHPGVTVRVGGLK